MPCNDLKCVDKFPQHIRKCINRGCSHSEAIRENRLSEAISCVIITDNCSSFTLRKIEKHNLTPLKSRIYNNWN